MLPSFLRQTFTFRNAISNGIWTIVYALVYAAVSAVVPVILHATTSLNGVWLALTGFALFCTLSAATLAVWTNKSQHPAVVGDETLRRLIPPPLLEAPDPCGDFGERLSRLAQDANVLADYLKNFDNWRPAVEDKGFDDKLPDGRPVTHAEAMQTLLYGFARFFSVLRIYERNCPKHPNRKEIISQVLAVYKALGGTPGGLSDHSIMAPQVHVIGEHSTTGWLTAEAQPIEFVEFRKKMTNEPDFAADFMQLKRFLLRAADPDTETEARDRLKEVQESVKRLAEWLKDWLIERGYSP